jgi:hypothetical protein
MSNDESDAWEALKCIKTLPEIVSKRYKFSVYREYIAY